MKTIGWLIVFIAVVSVVVDTGSTSAKQTLDIDTAGLSPAEQDAVQSAAQVLFDSCPGLVRYVADVDWIKASTGGKFGAGWQTDEYGWTHWIEFEVKISNNAPSLPRDWRAQGHTLFYSVGGGDKPGVAVNKETGGYFCGLGNQSGHIQNGAAAAVDKLR